MNLLTMFKALPVATLWSKFKLGLLLAAIGFMVWQGWQMATLQQDVTKLEATQVSLQAQVSQMSADYSVLRDNYKNNAQTSEQYIQSLNQLNGKTTDLEKSFSELDKNTAKASQKAITAVPRKGATTPGVSNETSSTHAHKSADGDIGSDDAEWRRLLDSTYCSTFPTDNKCSK